MSRDEHFQASVETHLSTEPSDEDVWLQINLRLHLDQVAEIEARQLKVDNRRQPTRSELGQLAGRIYDARRDRERIFDSRLFGEPAWDILLALYALPLRGELLTVSSLAIAAAVPPTTGLRWQNILMSQGLIERGPAGIDARKQFMRLTPEGRTLLERYLTRLYYCDAPIPPNSEAIGG